MKTRRTKRRVATDGDDGALESLCGAVAKTVARTHGIHHELATKKKKQKELDEEEDAGSCEWFSDDTPKSKHPVAAAAAAAAVAASSCATPASACAPPATGGSPPSSWLMPLIRMQAANGSWCLCAEFEALLATVVPTRPVPRVGIQGILDIVMCSSPLPVRLLSAERCCTYDGAPRLDGGDHERCHKQPDECERRGCRQDAYCDSYAPCNLLRPVCPPALRSAASR